MSKIRRKEGLELKKNLPGYLLMAPAVIAVLALSVYPLFRGIYLSFLNYNLVRPNDPAFNMSLEDLQKTMDPSKYVGRSPEQVDEFLAEVINPILEENKEILGMSATINV